jgi:hypothetical protein
MEFRHEIHTRQLLHGRQADRLLTAALVDAQRPVSGSHIAGQADIAVCSRRALDAAVRGEGRPQMASIGLNVWPEPKSAPMFGAALSCIIIMIM